MLRLLLVIGLLFLFSCESSKPLTSLMLTSPDGSKSVSVNVEIVDNESGRQLGLMYRKEMPDNQGMLFIFPTEEPRSFWMKNTFLELDMLFFDANKKLVSIVKRATPLTETGRSSNLPAKYCLEVLGGSADKWGVEPGYQLLGELGKQH
jgi:uncharacterized membrane protein (UPF0127 family)